MSLAVNKLTMLPDALWARKGPFLHSNKKEPCKQAGGWYFMITPP